MTRLSNLCALSLLLLSNTVAHPQESTSEALIEPGTKLDLAGRMTFLNCFDDSTPVFQIMILKGADRYTVNVINVTNGEYFTSGSAETLPVGWRIDYGPKVRGDRWRYAIVIEGREGLLYDFEDAATVSPIFTMECRRGTVGEWENIR